MKIRVFNILLSVAIAALFIWLALRNIETAELGRQIRSVTYYWVPFFVLTLTLSHYLRAERWRLLMPDGYNINRVTLFAGVMVGYIMNTIIPRLGEISRPVYVARKEEVSAGNLLGTIVAERLFDLFVMAALGMLAIFFLINDPLLFQTLLGIEQWTILHYSIIPLFFVIVLIGIWAFYKIILTIDKRIEFQNPVLGKLVSAGKSFSEGMISFNKVKNWPLFILLTAGIWTGYIIMTYLPFYMLNMQDVFGLRYADAVVLTVVSAIGVSIPTPAAIGSFHLLMQQALSLIYKVPLETALTYATVMHALTVLSVFIIGALTLWIDKYYTLAVLKKR
jgi:glycosyltransferase 2 family protein